MKTLEDVTIPEKEAATFQCELNDDDLKVKWYVKGREIKQSDKKYKVSGVKRTTLNYHNLVV